MIYTSIYNSKIGFLKIQANDIGIISIEFMESLTDESYEILNEVAIIKQCIKEIEEYFEGKRKSFDVNIIMEGTDFQKKVWKELMNIPYGETCSYKDIAVRIGSPKASRAVGGANNKNKIPIIIPCHRVVGAKGSLVGYAGGINKKIILLDNERNGLHE
ncbi:methylated-DNA--[protein]-cysteine S-methyltransferase [Clostridium grantii]|uniref:Methylated-DNA--protein-cysteine methyltransferase n=1 Tax=Clostridium grantii DSM 8605 TaxID=1121316 RepID=A0A1M5V8G1_9CLOT|nr:methylated-DNA--[protein]-cysteine S-methyltransferase [Clostridium grantii]SHH71501.1 methylated-DNA-[protein]-cysteine S-methyltransferase [Clostridium grantii DSM 8605]